MAKNKNRGPAPSHKTVSILIARAGGRCQFENCNKNVFLDEVTLDDTNDSNVAHIIASSPDGPRGSKTQSFEMSDKIENLMLMCLDHHHLIDEKGQEHIYTVERLRAMKASQEERVQKLMDNLNADVTTMLHLTSPIKGKQSDSFSAREAAKAFLPHMRAESEYAMTIGVPGLGDYKSAKYWESAEYWLDNNYKYNVGAKLNNYPNTHFSVFPLAPIPLIMKLGFLMGDKIRADVYQKTKHPDTWEWQSAELINDFKVEEKRFESGSGVAIVLSVTAEIEMEAVDDAKKDLMDNFTTAQSDVEIATLVECALGRSVTQFVFRGNNAVITESSNDCEGVEKALVPYKVQAILSAPQRQKLPSYPRGYRVIIGATIEKPDGTKYRYKSDDAPIDKDCSIVFTAGFSGVQKPFKLKWQVVNTGYQARSVNGLRGEFSEEGVNEIKHRESTLYTGSHAIQCFVFKKGRCVAQSKIFIVNIK